ncbi:hypothetical protein Zmor_011555 [Zophobas morio]|uniref:RNA-directed DNA polymerase from mobile element jockey n=1 Tax=Zophobas morio TaxID=2755281 RepID=A0AA38IKV4_9CUCU|nr:hypothetical protein Zmor_011555 [Zophobas morio]
MYADDVKLYNSSSNCMILSNDITSIHTWSRDWLIPLNMSKCRVLHLGGQNPRNCYYLNGVELSKTNTCSDLGVTITSDLSWSEHVACITRKANRTVYLITKAFGKANVKVIVALYKTYIRPILEFANSVWRPHLVRDNDLLEATKRRVTRLPFGQIRPSYQDRLKLMCLPLLSRRRKRGDAITVFRALTDGDSPIRYLFPLNTDGRTRGHAFKLLKEKFRTDVRKYFITNRVFEFWNSLPAHVVSCKNLTEFKIRLDLHQRD